MTNELDTEDWVDDFLTKLIEHTGLDIEIEEISLDENDVLKVQLAGPDSARAIGRDGQTLNAIQHLVVAASIRAGLSHRRVLVDIEDYRIRREERVREEASRLAEEALNSGVVQEASPMTARERRLVHMVVADIEGVSTESTGTGTERYVRIIPS